MERTEQHNWIVRMLFVTAILMWLPSSTQADDHNTTSAPVAAQLQAGDLIWPKKPEAVVPFNSRPGESNQEDANLWRQEKEAYLVTLRNKPNPTPEEKERYSVLRSTTYEEFAAQYLDDRIPGEPATLGVGGFYVGHVGIVEILNGKPMIVEAVWGKGVRRISYEEWLRERPGELVWLARLKDISPEKREAVAKTASQFIDKPYSFWNFNLLDTTGFYCSKLVWFSILAGAGFPPDDNPNPNRILWYSPKQLMRSRHIEFIANPGSYGLP
jgi:cell wall-associated NlpC family hydrolase